MPRPRTLLYHRLDPCFVCFILMHTGRHVGTYLFRLQSIDERQCCSRYMFCVSAVYAPPVSFTCGTCNKSFASLNELNIGHECSMSILWRMSLKSGSQCCPACASRAETVAAALERIGRVNKFTIVLSTQRVMRPCMAGNPQLTYMVTAVPDHTIKM